MGEHFINNPKNKRTINHKDGNRLNNNIDNLEWNTDSEQQLHKNRVISGRKRGVFKGSKNSWYSRIRNGNKYEYLGSFDSQKQAYSIFYNRYIEIHGVKPW